MELIVLRHGEAGNRAPSQHQDFERQLTVAGRKEVAEVADALEKLKIDVDYIITSPLPRAKETATIAAKAFKKQDSVETWDELKPEGETAALFRKLSRLKQESSALLVGHEPYLSGMISELISGGRQARILLKKAGVARVDVASFAPVPSGELRWLMTPRQLKKLS